MKIAWVYQFEPHAPIPLGATMLQWFIVTKNVCVPSAPSDFECVYDKSRRVLTIILDLNPVVIETDASLYLSFKITNNVYSFFANIDQCNAYWCGGSAVQPARSTNRTNLFVVPKQGPA